jgi:hypothetical protein
LKKTKKKTKREQNFVSKKKIYWIYFKKIKTQKMEYDLFVDVLKFLCFYFLSALRNILKFSAKRVSKNFFIVCSR